LDIETFAARGLQVLVALGGAYLIALWFVLAVWTFRDIETRSRSVVTQVFSTLLVVLFWVPGLLLYRLLRPSETLDEAYQRSLEEEYLIQDLEELPLCPSCNHFVEDDFQLCPHCNTQLREPCRNCERLIDLRWEVCPYCGTQHHEHHEHVQQPVSTSDEQWIDPAVIEKRLKDDEERRRREQTRALPAATAATTLGRDVVTTVNRQPEPDGDHHSVSNGLPARSDPQRVRILTGDDTTPNGTVPPARPVGPDLSSLIDGDEPEPEEADTTKVPDRYRAT
jgi:RNA polymerase subunit RPABC4/transcription elongation factor Spt4